MLALPQKKYFCVYNVKVKYVKRSLDDELFFHELSDRNTSSFESCVCDGEQRASAVGKRQTSNVFFTNLASYHVIFYYV